jgi:glycosyltransferase involved in cell wall biosynthesis
MKIGIEAERANLPEPTGVERYAAELIKNLAQLDDQNEYVLYFRTPPQEWFKHLPNNFTLRVIPFPKFWTQIRLSWELFWRPVDALMILASVLPLYHPKNSVFTAHDIAYEFFPDAFTGFMRRYLVFSTRYAVKRAARIVAVSQATKNDLVRMYGADPHKIEAIHLGVDERYAPMPYEQVQPVLDKYQLGYKKYILFVGTMQPRKNIVRLVEAFEKLKKNNHIEEKLVLVGRKGWLWEPIMKKIETSSASDSIKVLDYVDFDDLPALYNGAAILTLPALYEGFGLPPLEAMACGTPVVVSNVSSMPEVVGEAGGLVDPNSSDSIARGLLTALTDPEVKQHMSAKGIEQAKKFTWRACAKKTMDMLNKLKPN